MTLSKDGMDREFDKFVETADGKTGIRMMNIEYTQAIENDASGKVIYVGEAVAGSSKADPVWRIKKLVYDVNGFLTDVQWADGVTTFTKVWNSRSSGGYVYS